MSFGPIGLVDAIGAVLAHTQRLPDQILRKGTVLTEETIDALVRAGIEDVIALRLTPGDVPEDAAADRLAAALLTPGLIATRATTGRVNLLAEVPGLLQVDAAALDAFNLIDEALTVATLPNHASVGLREMVATIKVIPFAVQGAKLEAAEAINLSPLRLMPYQPLRVGLVMTSLPGMKDSILAGTAEATAARVVGLTGTLLPPIETEHTEPAIAAALQRLVIQGAQILLVAGASAVVDRRDVGPAGIVKAGGKILHFGMPVDPGNLICLGQIGALPALVLPGCARSPKLNGIDWVLARLFAGLPVDGRTLAGMGVGGLLKDGGRPMPRGKVLPISADRAATPVLPSHPPVAAVVLAAGSSSRMAPQHKLLLTDRTGTAMVARVVDHVLASTARPVIVVVGHRADEVRAALRDRDVTFVYAAAYADGLSASLRTGINAVPKTASAVLVCLGDMPLVTGPMMQRLIDAYDPDEGRAVIVPTCRGKMGNPVLWDRRFFLDITGLVGDMGARPLLDRHAEHVAPVEIGDDAVLRDFDTVDSLAGLPD